MTAGLIFKKLALVMHDVGAIGKDSRNQAQGFNYRGIDEIYNTLHEILIRHGVFTVPEVLSAVREERTTAKGTALVYSILTIKYRFYAEDGSFFEATVVGEGMDSGDKASNKAMSVAHKYCFIQVLSIPTREEKDPDSEDPTRGEGLAPKTAQARPKPMAAGNPPSGQRQAYSGPGKGPRGYTGDPGDVVCPMTKGRSAGKRVRDIPDGDLKNDIAYWTKTLNDKGELPSGRLQSYLDAAHDWLTGQAPGQADSSFDFGDAP